MYDSLTPIDYFESALPRILRARTSQATALGVNLCFVVTGRGGGTWTLRLRPPAACVVPGAEWKADLTITVTSTEMVKMIHGTFDARAAIRAGNIEMLGDMGVLRCVGFLFRGSEEPRLRSRPRVSTRRGPGRARGAALGGPRLPWPDGADGAAAGRKSPGPSYGRLAQRP
jgi:hypothetical protein